MGSAERLTFLRRIHIAVTQLADFASVNRSAGIRVFFGQSTLKEGVSAAELKVLG